MATALNYEISTTLLAERRISICRIRSTQDSGTSTPTILPPSDVRSLTTWTLDCRLA
jgi:hypothetical protein